MFRRILFSTAALVLLLAASITAHGQQPKPEPEPARLQNLGEEGFTYISLAWRYHPGDDPRWADPGFADTDWEIVEPQMPSGKLPRQGWPGTGWFRRHLELQPELWGKPLVIRVSTPGTTTVFLDGAPLMEASAPGGGRQAGVWREMAFSARPHHVLAVRHIVSSADRIAGSGNLGFLMSIETLNTALLQEAEQRREATIQSAYTLVPAFLAGFLALLHLALFLAYPKARENLFYALSMAFLSGFILVSLVVTQATGEEGVSLWARLGISLLLVTLFFGLLTHYSFRTRDFPRAWIAIAAVGGALILLLFLLPNPPLSWIWSGYFGLLLVEAIRMEITGGPLQREGITILRVGYVFLCVALVLQALIDLGFIPPIPGLRVVWVFGLLAHSVAMSLFLARSFGRTSLHLERRLDEVRSLSEQVLVQERAAHEQELHRRLLEAANARAAAEIEAARALQLSMLPARLPAVKGLEIAAAMAPASEVGGDYYDFRAAPDGGLVVAFGDATGHGVAAGIMVTAVKALFSTLGGGESLPAMLAETDRVVRGMEVRPFHMCLTLARLTPRSVTLCSAAMPPVLIRRAGSGEIEELGSGGRPIGSRLSGAWTEHSSPLAPGDVLLFASDGFAEQLDPAERPLGYEALAETLCSSTEASAAELVERLLSRVAAWRGEREQADDVTLVVVRVTE